MICWNASQQSRHNIVIDVDDSLSLCLCADCGISRATSMESESTRWGIEENCWGDPVVNRRMRFNNNIILLIISTKIESHRTLLLLYSFPPPHAPPRAVERGKSSGSRRHTRSKLSFPVGRRYRKIFANKPEKYFNKNMTHTSYEWVGGWIDSEEMLCLWWANIAIDIQRRRIKLKPFSETIQSSNGFSVGSPSVLLSAAWWATVNIYVFLSPSIL